ncbi:MAG TPA: energy-coupled thiamine transporter ThiT [Enterococcus columbae]|nr:energy-coupled thiamine transporter ThiT [Enterococcus columbae]
MNKKTEILLEGTLMAALAMALHFVPLNIGSSFTISLGQIPMTIFALRRGLKPALFACFLWGMLYFVTGQVYFLTPVQVLIEYPIAFTFAGFAGIYASKVQAAIANQQVAKVRQLIVYASLVGVGARFFWHFVAGWVFWGAYALWGMKAWLFSLVMNGASGLASGLVASIVIVLVYNLAPQILRVNSLNQKYSPR